MRLIGHVERLEKGRISKSLIKEEIKGARRLIKDVEQELKEIKIEDARSWHNKEICGRKL